MVISIASGKGGTGKTTVATNLALSLGDGVQFLDCDIEAPYAHLFIHPVFEKTEIITTPVPVVDKTKCDYCGKCAEICQFKAIAVIGKTVLSFPELCHSCGGCKTVCPTSAIAETGRELGIIRKGFSNGLEFVYGELRVGEAISPLLIQKVRDYSHPKKITIIDAPPGTSCLVIASVKDSHFVLLVTEPTPFGLHDLELAFSVVQLLGIPCGLVINRSDVGDDGVEAFAKRKNIPILMKIPFNRCIAEAYSRGKTIVEVLPEYKKKFLSLFKYIDERINYYK